MTVPERVRDRLVRAAAARLAPAGAADRLGRQRRDHEGDLDRRAARRPGRTRCFSSSPSPRRPQTYTFQVEQTYSDGSIVNWAGPESSAAPAPTIEAESSLGGGGVVGADDHRADRRRARPARRRVRARRAAAAGSGRWHEHAGADRRWRSPPPRSGCALPSAASAHAYLVKTVPAASGVLDAPPPNVAADLRRGGRAAVRDHLGHQRRRPAGDDRPGAAARPRTRTRWSCRCARICPRAGT